MFATPSPPPALGPLISHEEYNGMKRRQRTFLRFKNHPRASLPELKKYMDTMGYLLSLADLCWKSVATKENIEHLTELKSKSNFFENLLIRVVLGGEELEDVLKIKFKQ